MRVQKVESGCRAEVTEEPRLDVLRRERLAQERIVEQVDLADGEVVGRAPVRVEQAQLFGFHARTLDGHSLLELSRA